MWTGRCPRGHIPPWSPGEESLVCFCFNLLFWNLKTIQPFPEMLTKWGILMGSEKSCLLSVDKGSAGMGGQHHQLLLPGPASVMTGAFLRAAWQQA